MSSSSNKYVPSPAAGLSCIAGSYILSKLYTRYITRYDRPIITIKQLIIYPVKSCQGISVNSSETLDTGFKYDRQWMVYQTHAPESKEENVKNGAYITQRQNPRLTLISIRMVFESDVNPILIFSADNMPDIQVLTNMNDNVYQKNIELFSDKINGYDQGHEIAEWLTKFLNISSKKSKQYRLLRMEREETHVRLLPKSEMIPPSISNSRSTSFADCFPFLVLSVDSLKELNKRLIENGSISTSDDLMVFERFRPNIILKSNLNQPFIEDRMKECFVVSDNNINDGDCIRFYFQPCSRCSIPRINPRDGTRGKEPTLTLNGYRKGKHLEFVTVKEWDEKVFFGMHAVHRGNGIISVGDILKPVFR